ncbi:hypothetical protein BSLG_003362 [Batrachochytrium salamandrivorans]|nr:hypothetical protein BSLG_003362 [Batrachochytrium salamandrivorans]
MYPAQKSGTNATKTKPIQIYLACTDMDILLYLLPPITLKSNALRISLGIILFEQQQRKVPGGGLENDGELKLFFQGGGGFEFSSAFTQLRSRISPDAIPYEEPLPLYHNVAEAGASGSNTSTGDANPSPWQPSNIFNAAPSHQYQHLPSAPPQFHSYAPGAPLEPQPDTNSRMDRPLQQQAPPNPIDFGRKEPKY